MTSDSHLFGQGKKNVSYMVTAGEKTEDRYVEFIKKKRGQKAGYRSTPTA